MVGLAAVTVDGTKVVESCDDAYNTLKGEVVSSEDSIKSSEGSIVASAFSEGRIRCYYEAPMLDLLQESA